MSPQYSMSAGGVELVAMDLTDMPKKRFAAHILAVFDADNISIRQRSLVRCIFSISSPSALWLMVVVVAFAFVKFFVQDRVSSFGFIFDITIRL